MSTLLEDLKDQVLGMEHHGEKSNHVAAWSKKNDLMAYQSIAYLHVWTFPISGQITGRNSTLIEKEVHAERWNSDVLLCSRFSEPWKGLVFPSKMGPKISYSSVP